ncbi:hypothetical protein MCOR25_008416 [Pyricularia grisea]|uniref:Uncharacterized protein n=1 Tax=Pyricularia grisea TaxID=148305 RepID=A0A6P8AXK3_PYRGI|nr:hypothetical protein PgNI_11050 [Pyricularia grisea]KAI6354930.1 hypothetical protein MCOR25_008416 [Pyricularia grisea]TLD07075.1 hypothetical protein PgNI_11050 [Pyricularia grisea]
MQTSFATVCQLMLALFAAQAIAAPTASSSSRPNADKCEDEGFGCVLQCYGACAWVPRSSDSSPK